MVADTQAASEFYASRQGAVAARLVRDRLGKLWPEVRGQAVLGVGYAAPYLRLWREQAARCIAVVPPQVGVVRWPARSPSLTCAAAEDALPFPDLSFDRILLVHGLETAENVRRLLREVWRVLKDDGHFLIVAPNRRGMWAHVDSTPFGQGAPYSPGQIGRLLSGALFRVERRDTALYMPPANLRLILRGAHLWERGGRFLAPRLAGVTITEAVKDVYAAIPMGAVPKRRVVLAEAGFTNHHRGGVAQCDAIGSVSRHHGSGSGHETG
jgi:SAM-dependent methyltransferase